MFGYRKSQGVRTPARNENSSSNSRNTNNVNSGAQNIAILASTIESKRKELNNLLKMKQLSGDLCMKLEELNTKLSTMADGTEAVSLVLSNWSIIMKAVQLASSPLSQMASNDTNNTQLDEQISLPETLVRIRLSDLPEEKTNE